LFFKKTPRLPEEQGEAKLDGRFGTRIVSECGHEPARPAESIDKAPGARNDGVRVPGTIHISLSPTETPLSMAIFGHQP
jgi:hypothetical protein